MMYYEGEFGWLTFWVGVRGERQAGRRAAAFRRVHVVERRKATSRFLQFKPLRLPSLLRNSSLVSKIAPPDEPFVFTNYVRTSVCAGVHVCVYTLLSKAQLLFVLPLFVLPLFVQSLKGLCSPLKLCGVLQKGTQTLPRGGGRPSPLATIAITAYISQHVHATPHPLQALPLPINRLPRPQAATTTGCIYQTLAPSTRTTNGHGSKPVFSFFSPLQTPSLPLAMRSEDPTRARNRRRPQGSGGTLRRP